MSAAQPAQALGALGAQHTTHKRFTVVRSTHWPAQAQGKMRPSSAGLRAGKAAVQAQRRMERQGRIGPSRAGLRAGTEEDGEAEQDGKELCRARQGHGCREH